MRPPDTDALDDKQWGDYLFMRRNPKGQHFEQWHHSQGCRRWFNAERDTVSYRFKQFYKPGERPAGVEVTAEAQEHGGEAREGQFPAGPPQGKLAPSGGSEPLAATAQAVAGEVGERGGNI